MAPEQPDSPLDRHFADLLSRLGGESHPELRLAAFLVSRHRARGNICLPLEEIAGQPLAEPTFGFDRAPKAMQWANELRSTTVVGAPGEFTPLILDQYDRLYLRRYWEYEHSLTEAIKARVHGPSPRVDLTLLRQGLDQLFPETGEADLQKVAAFSSVVNNLTVITGGPGTGKTRTVVAILVLLLAQSDKPLRIALAAPSGKAAARLKESVQVAKETLNCSEAINARLPNEATTIHRLLGTIPGSPYFRHDANRPLLVDAVIVDEASMVDLATMSKLFAAVPMTSRIILLGDKDQLTSVEAGYVMGDICNTGAALAPSARLAEFYATTTRRQLEFRITTGQEAMRDSIVELRKNYRFASDSGIYQLTDAINRGDTERALEVLRDERHSDVTWRVLPTPRSLPRTLAEKITGGYKGYLEANDPAEALRRFADFRLLCAVRRGPYGVTELNRLAAEILSQAGLFLAQDPWYRGRPVMVTRNDYNLKLFNGDIGLAWPDAEASDETRVFFSATDGRSRRVLPSRVPAHETAFAMTVHKSQGSEFNRVLLILPENDSPVLTRELLYTGLTRVRDGVEIWSTEKIFRSAIAKRIERTSGLRDALWT